MLSINLKIYINMKTLNNGQQVEILKVFRNQSNNFKNNKRNEYADLLKVKYSNGKMEVICSTQLDN